MLQRETCRLIINGRRRKHTMFLSMISKESCAIFHYIMEDCNINVEFTKNHKNRKILVVLHNLKNYDSHFIMQKLGKFNLKINVIPNGLEKYMNFSINNKLSFIDSFKFLSSLLDSVVKNLSNDYFNYLSQKFDNNVLDLVKQKIFYSYECMSDFEKSKNQLTSKEKFYSLSTGKKN